MTSYFTLIAHGVISWMSCQQKTVILSSTEAEYIALSDCGCQLVWTRNLLNEVSFNVPTLYIYSGNLNSLFQGSNPIQEKYFKHIDIYYHYIRDLIENEQVKQYHIDGKKNIFLQEEKITLDGFQVGFDTRVTISTVEIRYNDKNPADILTKNLGQVLFSCFCPSLGLKIL